VYALLVHFLHHSPAKGIVCVVVFQRAIRGITGPGLGAIIKQLVVHGQAFICYGRDFGGLDVSRTKNIGGYRLKGLVWAMGAHLDSGKALV